MSSAKNGFDVKEVSLTNGTILHIINIKEIDESLNYLITKRLVSICEGNSGSDIVDVKLRLIKFLSSKRGSNIELGAVAEFISHVYLNEYGFSQNCLFLNLEEGSIKKGFDGYYSKDEEEWIYESKSGNISSGNISHHSKIKDAYDDLKSKIAGEATNDPWKNAYNHAAHIDVGSDRAILDALIKLSKEYLRDIPHDIGDFNIIPGSTIFMEGVWADVDIDDIVSNIEKNCSDYNCNKMHIICINKKDVELFWEYINS